jgi:hypothetical protein
MTERASSGRVESKPFRHEWPLSTPIAIATYRLLIGFRPKAAVTPNETEPFRSYFRLSRSRGLLATKT